MRPPAFLHPFSEPARTDFTRVVSGGGCWITDEHGNSYLDAIASLWCVNVGHGRREVIDAVTSQMESLATYNTFGSWSNEPADHLAEMISERAPMPAARVFFTTSGSEAVDTAIKLARLTHQLGGDEQRLEIVSRHGGYHGTAYGGTSLQGIEANRTGFGQLLEGVIRVGRHDLEEISQRFERDGDRIAAVISEPVQGAGGVHPPEPGYLEGLRRLCDSHGALLILDEVITGFGRLGHWFAGLRYGVEPDLATFAKAATSGYVPLGGVIVGERVRSVLEADPAMVLRTGFTYSGHPTAAAAGVACIEVTEREGLLARAEAIGERLGAGLRDLLAAGSVTDVRGVGAIWAVDVPAEPGRGSVEVTTTMRRAGVIVRPIGDTTIAMCPPLVMTDDEVDLLAHTLDRALAS